MTAINMALAACVFAGLFPEDQCAFSIWNCWQGCAQVDDEPSWRRRENLGGMNERPLQGCAIFLRMLDGVNMGAVIIDKTVPHHYGHFSLVTSEPRS